MRIIPRAEFCLARFEDIRSRHTGEALHTHLVSGAESTASATTPRPQTRNGCARRSPRGGWQGPIGPDSLKTYADSARYKLDSAELVWKRTLGGPANEVPLARRVDAESGPTWRRALGSIPEAASRYAAALLGWKGISRQKPGRPRAPGRTVIKHLRKDVNAMRALQPRDQSPNSVRTELDAPGQREH